MNTNQMHNLAFFIERAFEDDSCEEGECALCPFFIRAHGDINGEECYYVCDFLYNIKRSIENDK